jgi:HlyD family secretion protein
VWADLSFGTGGQVVEWFVEEGDLVETGTPLGLLDTVGLERSVIQAELGLHQAQLRLEQLQQPADEAEIRQAEHAIDQAADALKVAQLDLTAVLNSTLLNETLEDAQGAFEDAKYRYEVRLAEYERDEIDYWFVERALERYEDAELALARVQQQVDLQLESARNEVNRAQQAFQEAQDNLAQLLEGADSLELESAQLDVEVAQVALEEARSNLEGATLIAPFDSTVVALHLQSGDWAGVGVSAVTLADLSTLRVETTDLDEWGAAQIRVGSEATVVFNAFDDKTLTGRVTEIGLRGEKLPAGDVIYRAIIELGAPDADLRWGMTVRITIPVEE